MNSARFCVMIVDMAIESNMGSSSSATGRSLPSERAGLAPGVRVLLEAALADMASRERQGQRAPVEEFLKGMPALAADAEAVLDLIHAELMAREKRGDKPALKEYLGRFPHLHEQLRVLFQFEDALARTERTEMDRGGRNRSRPDLSELDRTELPGAAAAPAGAGQGSVAEGADDHTEIAAATTLPTSPEAAALEALQARAQFSDLRLLAQGGLGVVYLGKDRELKREVAIKFIQKHLCKDDLSRQQFALEAEVTGRLEHPGVVPLYGCGATADGQLFYVMRYIEGTTLDAAIKEFHTKRAAGALGQGSLAHSFDCRKLLGHFISVCRTIAYAHNRGIIHRDVKPENVMLGRYGETLVVDWGLAMPVARAEVFKLSGEQTLGIGSKSGSSSGSWAGTPAYMSPEQASQLPPTPAGDIYSLGATLYKLLIGKAAVSGHNLDEVRQRVISGDYKPPRQLSRDVPVALEAICLKAMALRPQDRYVTALELANDLERFLADEAVIAHTDTFFGRLTRWGRRHRTATRIGLAALCLVLTIAIVAAVGMGRMADDQRAARVAAEAARRDNLRTSALFAARSVAQEIDLRWRILESEENSPTLRQLLKAVNDDAKDAALRKPLNDWLQQRALDQKNSVKTASWVITSLDGVLAARSPPSKLVGQKFGFRDYFHGKGRDLTDDDIKNGLMKPVNRPHLSNVFRSQSTGHWAAAFSVPIWSDGPENLERTPLGVLSMTVELNEFEIPGEAILADMREDRWGKVGLVLHHPRLTGKDDDDNPPRLDQKSQEQAQKLIRSRQSNTFLDSVIEAFPDPANPAQSSLVALEPVFVKARPQALSKTGWVVIIQD